MPQSKKSKNEIKTASPQKLQTQVEKAFAATNTKIYNRNDEVEKITKFLDSSDSILNIVGVPGTGKTSIVLSLCKKLKKFKYLNYYKTANIKKEILKAKSYTVVIDEFDKFYERQPLDCKFVIHHLASNKCKLITLGNNLEYGCSSIVFRPYTSLEIEEIIKTKIEKEIGVSIISALDLKILCRKYSNGGDMRAIFKFILTHFNPTTGLVTIENNEENIKENVSNNDDVSIHHKIILKLGSKAQSKVQSFRLYFAECEEFGVTPLSRTLFFDLFDTLCYK